MQTHSLTPRTLHDHKQEIQLPSNETHTWRHGTRPPHEPTTTRNATTKRPPHEPTTTLQNNIKQSRTTTSNNHAQQSRVGVETVRQNGQLLTTRWSPNLILHLYYSSTCRCSSLFELAAVSKHGALAVASMECVPQLRPTPSGDHSARKRVD